MLSDALKEQTLANHQLLEKKLVLKIKAIENTAEYAGMLKLFYSYFGGLEMQINRFINENILPDYNDRRKTDAIANDIGAFGQSPDPKADGDDMPEINNVAQAFGALYVIEGSTLGGSIISNMLTGRLGVDKGLSFFNGYGEDSHRMWGLFLKELNSLPAADEQQVVKAASDTFLKFADWIDSHA